jgi:hypothetical protein
MTEEELKRIQDEVRDASDDMPVYVFEDDINALIAEVRRHRGNLRERLIALCQAMHDMWPPDNAVVSVKNGRPEIRWTVGEGEDKQDDFAEFAPWHFEMSDEAFAAYVQLLKKQRDYKNQHLREYAAPPPYRTHINAEPSIEER